MGSARHRGGTTTGIRHCDRRCAVLLDGGGRGGVERSRGLSIPLWRRRCRSRRGRPCWSGTGTATPGTRRAIQSFAGQSCCGFQRMKLMLPSPNGSRLSLACGDTPVLTGCLRNSAAVARAARKIAGDGDVGVIPAGELWPDGLLRPAIEDLLGAGAVIHHLDLPCSSEAQIARDAYRSAARAIATLIRASVSGRQLIDGGFPQDVEIAVEENVSAAAPTLTDGAYRDEIAPSEPTQPSRR
jgi:hypothetical protein